DRGRAGTAATRGAGRHGARMRARHPGGSAQPRRAGPGARARRRTDRHQQPRPAQLQDQPQRHLRPAGVHPGRHRGGHRERHSGERGRRGNAAPRRLRLPHRRILHARRRPGAEAEGTVLLWLAGPAMPKPGETGLRRVLSATRYSVNGLKACWRCEAAFRAEALASVVLLPAALLLGEGGVEKALLAASWLLVLVIELVNSAIEAVVDRIGDEYHVLSGQAK